jgi:hypothetical protein
MPVYATKLDAVNTILAVIGESPVNSLDGNSADVAMAVATLEETMREVLSEKWRFNSDEKYPLRRDTSGEVTLPAKALLVDIPYPEQREQDVTVRGRRLYNRTASSYKLKHDIEAEVRWWLDFEELPTPAGHYITIRAARRFADRVMASQVVHGYTAEEEVMARHHLTVYDSDEGDVNVFNQGEGLRLQHRELH